MLGVLAGAPASLVAANSLAHHPSPYLSMHASDEDFNYLEDIWQLDQVDSSETDFLARPLIGPGASGEVMRNSKIRQQLHAVEKPAMPGVYD